MIRSPAGALVFLGVLLTGGLVSGGDGTPPLVPPLAPPRIDGDGGTVPHPLTGKPEARDEEPRSRATEPPIEHRSILLDLAHVHPPRLSDLNELAQEKPYLLIRSYRGIQGLIMRRLRMYYRDYYSTSINGRIYRSGDSLEKIDHRIEQYREAQEDLDNGGRWWDRPYAASLTPAQGGAPAQATQIRIGENLEVFRLGEFALTTDGRLRGGRLSLFLDDERIYESASRGRLLEPGAAQRPVPTQTPPLRSKDPRDRGTGLPREDSLEVGVNLFSSEVEEDLGNVLRGTTRDRELRTGPFRTPTGNFLTGDHWNMSVAASVALRLPQSLSRSDEIFNSADAEIELCIFPEITRQKWRILSLRVSGQPGTHDYSGMLLFEVACW